MVNVTGNVMIEAVAAAQRLADRKDQRVAEAVAAAVWFGGVDRIGDSDVVKSAALDAYAARLEMSTLLREYAAVVSA